MFYQKLANLTLIIQRYFLIDQYPIALFSADYHRAIKQVCHIEHFQVRSEQPVKNHTDLQILQFYSHQTFQGSARSDRCQYLFRKPLPVELFITSIIILRVRTIHASGVRLLKWGLLAVAVIGELRKVMNTVPGTSSYHGIYPASPEAMEKGKEIEIGEEPMEMKGMAGGRSISPAAEEWSALSIAPARHDAGISEAVGRISLCQKTAVQATQQATSEMASATLINRDNSGRIQLPREFETTVLSRTLASISQAEQNATGEQREMLALIRKAFELLSANKLKGVYEPVETVVRPYIRRHPEDKVVAYRFWQYEVHSEYAANNIGQAIKYYFSFFKDENGNSLFKPIDFTDNFFFHALNARNECYWEE